MPRTFIDHLNHEIRSPLTVVVGMAELFSLSTLTDEQRQWLRTMQQAVQSILRLMDGAVDFSRLSANQLALRTEPFSLKGVLSEVRQTLAQNNPPTDLEASIQDGAPDDLIGDGARLRQALVGLAEHLILVRGIRRLGIHVALRSQTAEAVALEFAVGDADRPPAARNSPSDPPGEFIACAEVTVDRRRGLELAVAAGLAGAMHGSVWVAADKDAAVAGRLAATFALPSSSLSFNNASFDKAAFNRAFGRELGPERQPAPVGHGPKRILLAEDTRAIRQCLVSLLERHGHTVMAAKHGLQAIQILECEARAQRRFDVAILDLEMPVMDGWEAAREIRKRTASRPIRVIALTAHCTEGNPELLGSADFDAVVGKPLDAERLFEAIASCGVSLPPPPETLPTETLPSETLPSETLPSETLPSETLPSETLPSETLPSETLPSETLPSETLPSETLPSETLPSETLPSETLPSETLPSETLPSETLPSETLPSETLPSETLPSETLPSETLPSETLPSETLPSETLPSETLPSETLPSETLPSETLPSETLPPGTPRETNGDCDVDYAGALARLCGNEQLLDDLVQFFLNDSPELLAEARAAIGRRDAKALERTAHGIRGLASNFGAQPTVNAAAVLEELGHDAALDDAESAYQDLETEVRRLAAILEQRAGSSASRGDVPR